MKLLTVLFSLLSIVTYSQKSSLQLMDSIHQAEFDFYDLKARENFFKAPDSTLYYAKKCKLLANQNNNLFGKIEAQDLLGNAQYLKGNYIQAIEIFIAVLKIIETTKESKIKSWVLIETYDGLGCTYCEAGFFKQGIPYLYTAKNLAIAINSTDDILNETGSIGVYYEKSNQIDSAEYYLIKALSIANKPGFEFYRGFLLNSSGNCEMKKGMATKAVDKWKETIKYISTDAISAGLAYQSLGSYYLKDAIYDSSYANLRKAVEMATQTNNTEKLFAANNLLLALFKRTNKTDSVNYYLNVCYSLRDSVDSKQRTKDLQNIYISEQLRQKSIADAKVEYRNLVILFIFCTIIAALVLLSFIQFRNNKQRQKANLLLQNEKQKVETTLSELKSTQAQLIQSEKMASLGELTAGIAHEIQNPLNFVNNFSEVSKELLDEMKAALESGNKDEAEEIANDIIQNLEKINHHGKRADAIVKSMLQHSRQTKGIKEPTDINALCDEYLRLSYHGLRAKDKSFNADFKTDFDKSIGKINIIPQDIGRVLLNLFNNAFYAVNEKLTTHSSPLTNDYKPLVSIQTKKLNDKIEIKVADNGNGIPQNVIDKIFQPFFTTKPTGQGTGLGLSLAYDIITKEHNGSIKAESKEGEGSEFIIQLPNAI